MTTSPTDAFEDAEIAREEAPMSANKRLIAEARSDTCAKRYTAKEAKSLALNLADALDAARAQIENQALVIGEAWELADEGVVDYGTQAWMAIRMVLAQGEDE